LVLALLAAAGCSKARDEASRGAPETLAIAAGSSGSGGGSTAAPPSNCAHAACADNFYVDAVPAACTAGSPCVATLKLVATSGFHINDEYPYRFKADDAPGIRFLGTDASGASAFSKAAGDWQKTQDGDGKTGVMTVKFVPEGQGDKTIAGTLKLSVCSPQSCLVDQQQVRASVSVK
jgi:hypothetical protein